MILVDYHMHSNVSHDGVGTIAEHVRAAEERGLAEICFTEHLDFYPSPDGLSCTTLPTEARLLAYLEEMREAQQHSHIVVRAGLEVDYKPEAGRWVRDVLSHFEFDFLLGSVHNVGTWPVSGPPEMAQAYFRERGAEQGCLDYLEIVERAVATDLFDSVAHLDLMKRFQPVNGELMKRGRLRDQIVAILDMMAANGTGIEVNAAGLVHDPREAYPSLYILKLARERGVQLLTVGSDSHRPETVGRNLDAALSLARQAGFTRLYTFEQRAPSPHAL